MTKSTLVLVVLTISVGQPDERLAIRKVLDDQVAAWNRGDLDGFMKGYWHSPELTFFSGNDTTRGWQATLERYRKRYQGEGKEMGKLSFDELKFVAQSSDQAVVTGRFRVVLQKGTPTGLFTVVLKKFAAGWLIVHDHTSS